MSLRFKIPLLILFAFILNLLMIFLFYWLYLSGRVEQNLDNMQKNTINTMNITSAEINGKAYDDAVSYLNAFKQPGKYVFVLQDIETGKQTILHAGNIKKIEYTQINQVILSGKSYIFEVQKDIDILNLRSKTVTFDLLFFECVIMFVIFLITGVLLHFYQVKPLLKLQAYMKHYKEEPIPVKTRRSKDEIGQLEESFLQLSASLNEEKEVQNRIIASISHDIKTPLTSVLGYTERLLKKEVDKERQNQYLRTIYNQAKDIEAIVQEFDEYLGVLVENKKQTQTYSVPYICQMLTEEYSAQLADRNIQFAIQNHVNADVSIQADLIQFRCVFANIIGNSIRHANAEHLQIHVEISNEIDRVKFEISDNGQGVSKDDQDHIFEPFYTSDKSRHISGLGLSICKSIIEGMSGTIQTENLPDHGFLITIYLPLINITKEQG